jgi:hypothetical protein
MEGLADPNDPGMELERKGGRGKAEREEGMRETRRQCLEVKGVKSRGI